MERSSLGLGIGLDVVQQSPKAGAKCSPTAQRRREGESRSIPSSLIVKCGGLIAVALGHRKRSRLSVESESFDSEALSMDLDSDRDWGHPARPH